MRLPTFLIFLFQVVLVKSRDFYGYLGENITLHSTADPAWNLIRIEWSVLSNNTLIATYEKKKTNLDRVSRYKGRLWLNTTSGDLTIYNLTTTDAMEYTVVLINNALTSKVTKITLAVEQRLQKPLMQIDTYTSTPTNGSCLIVVNCFSQDKGVSLSWHVEPSSVNTISESNPDGGSAYLIAIVNTAQTDISFTCISSKKMENNSNVITSNCKISTYTTRPPSSPQPPSLQVQQYRDRPVLFFFIGAFIGCVITVIYFYRDQIKSAIQKRICEE